MIDDDDEIDQQWSTEVSKKPITPQKSKSPALVVDNKNKTSYSAFETKDKPLGFLVRCVNTHVEYTCFYHHLLTIALDTTHEDFFTLITSNAVIQVYGQNLRPITAAFRLHTCDSITEFSPEMFLPPSDDSQPFIEKIEVLLPTPAKKKQEAKLREKTEGDEA